MSTSIHVEKANLLSTFFFIFIYLFLFIYFFCSDKSAFCGVTGTFHFGLQLTLPIGFKARVDAKFA